MNEKIPKRDLKYEQLKNVRTHLQGRPCVAARRTTQPHAPSVVADDQLRTPRCKRWVAEQPKKEPRQVLETWRGSLTYLTRNEAIARAQITNLRQQGASGE